ncbi:hypothetical protein RFI_28994 [Reticulomyxa filosa]|uniref:Uncharacterized protein n=1 Tax=Reticulomyxa filosa TaxID=46433 RepID=X6M358_RETFI|nr:hypothetical protein RFI_28994 [Reticulomyxa filosa]|eukprot:ETO08393.1 hypothetical protein RFI_28994 [Reticulomyxa filosa]
MLMEEQSRVVNRLAIHYYHCLIICSRTVNHSMNNDEIIIDNANKKRPSVEIKPIDRRNLKRSKPDDDNIENKRIQSNKKQKTQILQKGLMIRKKGRRGENIWKESKKIRKDSSARQIQHWFLQM